MLLLYSTLLVLCALPLHTLGLLPPIVIFNVIVDDLGNANTGWHTPNPPENLTPRLTALAKAGVILERQYNHFTCTPSRSAFTTGRLPVHVQLTLDNPDYINAGIPVNMTALPLKLQAAGYTTAVTGKWDMGFAGRLSHLPLARGYKHSLVYAEHMNNYWSKRIEPTGTSCSNASLYDLWEDSHPATALVGNNSDYIDDIFHRRALEVIANFSLQRAQGQGQGQQQQQQQQQPSRLFLDYRPHSMHWPLMVDQATLDAHSWVGDDEAGCRTRFYGDAVYPGGGVGPAAFSCRRQYQAMLSNLDRRIGEVVDALQAAGLWEGTLMTFMSDNGGCVSLSENAGNNYPLRSGKYHPFEGGVRVAAMWSGGYLPLSSRGTVSTALVSVADYYLTLCLLAGLGEGECLDDPLARNGGLPPIDSRDVWALVTGADTTPVRTELPIDATVLLVVAGNSTATGGGGAGEGGPWWKLYTAPQVPGAGWTGAVFPNASSPDPEEPTMVCGKGGCLFDVWGDPSESVDVAQQHPEVVAAMRARLGVLAQGFYSNSDKGGTSECPQGIKEDCLCWAAENNHGGFVGPFHSWP